MKGTEGGECFTQRAQRFHVHRQRQSVSRMNTLLKVFSFSPHFLLYLTNIIW